MRAIRKLLHWIWAGLDGLRKILHLLLLLLIFGVIGAVFSRPIPLVPDQRGARHRAAGSPGRAVHRATPLERAIGEVLRQGPTETRLRDVVEAIDAASKDERISSLYLDLGGLDGGGTAKLQEVAAAIDRFRKTGKPVIAFGEYYDQPQYYLAAHADEIYLDPQGIAYVDGFANYGLFVQGRARQAARSTGTSSASASTSRPSRCSRATTCRPPSARKASPGSNSVWTTWKADVAKARGIQPAVLQDYADNAAAVAAQGRRRPREAGARRRARDAPRRTLPRRGTPGRNHGHRRRRALVQGRRPMVVPRERELVEGAVDQAGRQDRRHRRRGRDRAGRAAAGH